jgi:bacteriorhodopsin
MFKFTARWTYYGIRVGIFLIICASGAFFHHFRNRPDRFEIIPSTSTNYLFDTSIEINTLDINNVEQLKNSIDESLKGEF